MVFKAASSGANIAHPQLRRPSGCSLEVNRGNDLKTLVPPGQLRSGAKNTTHWSRNAPQNRIRDHYQRGRLFVDPGFLEQQSRWRRRRGGRGLSKPEGRATPSKRIASALAGQSPPPPRRLPAVDRRHPRSDRSGSVRCRWPDVPPSSATRSAHGPPRRSRITQ